MFPPFVHFDARKSVPVISGLLAYRSTAAGRTLMQVAVANNSFPSLTP